MLRHILVPIDFRFFTRAPLITAAMLAREHGADITLLYVEDPNGNIPGVPFTPIPADQIDGFNRYIAQFLTDAALVVLRNGAWARVQSVRGAPAHVVIREYAAGTKADLIVMGTHGRAGSTNAMWSWVTDEVVASADVPVMVIHESTNAAPRLSA
jgi:nucleotide-binding universal stress UspA family protein